MGNCLKLMIFPKTYKSSLPVAKSLEYPNKMSIFDFRGQSALPKNQYNVL